MMKDRVYGVTQTIYHGPTTCATSSARPHGVARPIGERHRVRGRTTRSSAPGRAALSEVYNVGRYIDERRAHAGRPEIQAAVLCLRQRDGPQLADLPGLVPVQSLAGLADHTRCRPSAPAAGTAGSVPPCAAEYGVAHHAAGHRPAAPVPTCRGGPSWRSHRSGPAWSAASCAPTEISFVFMFVYLCPEFQALAAADRRSATTRRMPVTSM